MAPHKTPFNPFATGPLFTQTQIRYFMYFIGTFLLTVGVLAAFGLLPNELQEQTSGNTLAQSVENSALGIITGTGDKVSGANDQTINEAGGSQYGSILGTQGGAAGGGQGGTINTKGQRVLQNGFPSELIIPSIGLDTKVIIPHDANVDTLDHDLSIGPVYYPGSGTVASGNMFIFGHSTGYKVVINKAYRVFNDIHTLNVGEEIDVVSEGVTFIYKVKSVTKVNGDQTLVEFDTKSHLLTLSTCDSFGSKSDRYVVVAEYSALK